MTDDSTRVLFWHRRDLRITDNVGLRAAASKGRVVPVFCLDDEILQYAGPPRVAFLLEALHDLRDRYRELGTDLLVVRGDPTAEIVDVADEYDVDAAVWNEDYSGLARDRDEAVEDALSADGIGATWTTDAVVHAPGTIRTNAGDPYSVFTYFWKKWDERDADPAVIAPDSGSFVDIEETTIPDPEDLGFDAPDASIPDGTRRAAVKRLRTFLDDPVYDYVDERDRPAAGGTSRLSQDLKFGLLGIREVYEGTERAMEAATTDDERDSVREFQRQLAWREFYAQVLAFNPETVRENFKSYERPIDWRTDPSGLEAWKRGQTGYPIVDAGMRQLLKDGYMHNRVRMIVASFLTKDLLLDWRQGYRWFRQRLVDHDTANDVGGWQWAASTGTDAQPYFRIFNPMTQGERYDPAATYIHEYVEELRDVPADTIHDWNEISAEERREAAPEYPDPIVDHAERRTAAIELFERARGDD